MALGIFADEPTRFRSKKLWELAVLSINTAFFRTTPDEAREILIEIAIDAVFLFNHLNFGARRHDFYFREEGQATRDKLISDARIG